MHRRAPATAAILLAFLIAGCGRHDDVEGASPGNFVPPVTQPPTPLPGQAQATPLTNYVGHYPRDAVDGVSFYDRTEVANLLVAAVPEEALRRRIVGRDATVVPIVRIGSRVAAHGCAAHDCGDLNWTVLVSTDGDLNAGAVCYHDAATMGATSRWSERGGTERRPGDCPQG